MTDDPRKEWAEGLRDEVAAGETMTSLARRHGITRERVRQILAALSSHPSEPEA